MKLKEHVRAQWMSQFADRVEALAPHMAGRIDWNTATHYFLTDLQQFYGPSVRI